MTVQVNALFVAAAKAPVVATETIDLYFKCWLSINQNRFSTDNKRITIIKHICKTVLA
jgi:hypothetical protein